jgi:hypothetical protein
MQVFDRWTATCQIFRAATVTQHNDNCSPFFGYFKEDHMIFERNFSRLMLWYTTAPGLSVEFNA